MFWLKNLYCHKSQQIAHFFKKIIWSHESQHKSSSLITVEARTDVFPSHYLKGVKVKNVCRGNKYALLASILTPSPQTHLKWRTWIANLCRTDEASQRGATINTSYKKCIHSPRRFISQTKKMWVVLVPSHHYQLCYIINVLLEQPILLPAQVCLIA